MARSVREIDKNEDKYVGIRFPLDFFGTLAYTNSK